MTQTLALPLRVSDGGPMVAVTVDSPAEVAQSVALLLSTRPGERRSTPLYGMPEPAFGSLDENDVVGLLETWEDRASAEDVRITISREEQLLAVYGPTFGLGLYGAGLYGVGEPGGAL